MDSARQIKEGLTSHPYDIRKERPAIGLPIWFVRMNIEFFSLPEKSNIRAVIMNEKELYLRN